MQIIKKSIKKLLGIESANYTKIKEDTTRFDDTDVGALQEVLNPIIDLNPRVTSHHEMVALNALAAVASGNILEIGSYLCYSSVIMATAFKHDRHRKLYAIDPLDRQLGWKNNSSDDWIFKTYSQHDYAKKIISDFGLEGRINLKIGKSTNFVSDLTVKTNIGMMFIDGDHSEQAVTSDLNNFASCLNSGGFLIMHDYLSNLHSGVRIATDRFLKQNPNYERKCIIGTMLIITKA